MRYFKYDNSSDIEIMTFEDREYRQMEFFISSNVVGINASDESITIWLERTHATEIPEEEYNSLFPPAENAVVENTTA